jgi:hypothetical protein
MIAFIKKILKHISQGRDRYKQSSFNSQTYRHCSANEGTRALSTTAGSLSKQPHHHSCLALRTVDIYTRILDMLQKVVACRTRDGKLIQYVSFYLLFFPPKKNLPIRFSFPFFFFLSSSDSVPLPAGDLTVSFLGLTAVDFKSSAAPAF